MASDATWSREAPKLCYLDAEKVTLPAGVLADLDVVGPHGEPVGKIAGVVIEAAARRVRYLDVRASGSRRRRRVFVPADHLAQVDPERKELRLLSSDVEVVPESNVGELREFSDDDLRDVISSPHAA